jgi:signal transduction histidine kinase
MIPDEPNSAAAVAAATALLQTLDLATSAESCRRLVLDLACRTAGATHGALLLPDEADRSALTIASLTGPDWPAGLTTGCRLPDGPSLARHVATTGLAVRRIGRSETEATDPLCAGLTSTLTVPLEAQGKLLAVLHVGHAAADAFTPSQLAQLILLARIAALGLARFAEANERSRLQAQVLHLARLAMLGENSADVAHELCGPLTAIAGLSELLVADALLPAATVRARLSIIASEARRGAQIARDTLSTARRGSDVREPCELNELVRTALALTGITLKARRISMEVHASFGLAPVMASPEQVMQVVRNLVINAAQAVAGKPAGQGVVRVAVHLRPPFATVEIADNGCGVHPENRTRIFESFFTTKSTGEGSGLGLSLSRSIARAHGGDVRLVSSSPLGSTFVLELPLLTRDEETVSGRDDDGRAAGAGFAPLTALQRGPASTCLAPPQSPRAPDRAAPI